MSCYNSCSCSCKLRLVYEVKRKPDVPTPPPEPPEPPTPEPPEPPTPEPPEQPEPPTDVPYIHDFPPCQTEEWFIKNANNLLPDVVYDAYKDGYLCSLYTTYNADDGFILEDYIAEIEATYSVGSPSREFFINFGTVHGFDPRKYFIL